MEFVFQRLRRSISLWLSLVAVRGPDLGEYSKKNLYRTYDLTKEKLDSLFLILTAGTVALNIGYDGLLSCLLMVLSIKITKKLFLNNILNSTLECNYNQNGQNQCPIYEQNGRKTIPFRTAHTYIAHIREYPTPVEPDKVHQLCTVENKLELIFASGSQ